MPGECRGIWGNVRECAMCQRNAGKSRRIPGEHMGVGEMSRECRRMPGERMEVHAKCQQNAGECQGNVWE